MYSFVLLAAVALLVVGILSVSSAKFTTTPAQTFTPLWVQASASNATLNVTISNDASSPAAIVQVDVSRPSGVSNIECGALLPSGFACSRISATKLRIDGGSIAAGSSAPFQINITPPAGSANYTFTIDTAQAGGAGVNTTLLNVSVDANPPLITLVNISTSVKNITVTDSFLNAFLNNASGGVNIVVQVTDNASDVGNVTLTYNYTLSQDQTPVPVPDRRFAAATGNISIPMFNASFSSAGLFNATIPTAGFTNGTRVVFSILANDTAGTGNGNVSNQTVTYGWNFTIDAVAPQFVDVVLSNGSQNNTNAINTTSVLTSKVEYIINSSVFLNLSVLVRDDGGSGTVKVEVMNRSGTFMLLDLITGANGSSTQTSWKINATTNVSGGNGNYNITDLVTGFGGNGLYNITIRATDNVTNQNSTYNFTVEVDDTPPTLSVTTNITRDGVILSIGNTTLSNTSINNTAFVIRVITVGNVNNITDNLTVVGNLGNFYNLSFESGTPSGTAIWNLTVKANTLTNITQFCAFGSTPSTFGPDASTCNFRFRISDVMGRVNNSVNLTIAVDSLIPNVSIVSPASLTTNYTGTVLINVSVNDSVGPLQNVSFRIRNNATAEGSVEGFYSDTQINVTNVTNWIPMSLGAGGNTQFNAQGYWNFTVNLTALNFSDGINYTIEINATDGAGRQNTSVNVSRVVFDSTVPTNITVMSGLNVLATNSFQRAMFNVTANATEITSGLFNVSFRIENSSFNWPWVDGSQVVTALTAGQSFNASQWNFTHWGGERTNATNGNFTLRLNVTDTAGNQNTSVTINFTIDTIVPAVSFVFPVNNRNQTGNFTVNASITESNINLVQLRWENGTITQGNSNNGTFGNNPMTYNAAESRANATFTNLTDGSQPLMFDSNYTIRLNITDKAGNINDTVYIQLVLDKTPPAVVAVGPGANSIQTGNFLVNMTFNDNLTVAGTSAASLVNSTNINSSAYRLENNTFNSSWIGLPNTSTDFAAGNVDRNRTNATFTFTSVANGRYDIRFWVNDTAGNQNSSVVVLNVTLDNVAPTTVFSISNVTPSASGDRGVSGNVTFNVSVTDNLPLNISVTNYSHAQTTTYGVFYRFENSTFNASWLPMSTDSFNQSWVHNNTGREHTAVFNATNTTAVLADGDYRVRINVTDKANNQVTSATVEITLQNAGSKVRAVNLTFQGGLLPGTSDTNQTSPTWLVNTTANATCRYSLDTPVTNYDDMANTLNNNVSRQHSRPLGFLPDRAANGYSIDYACKDVGGNFTLPDGVSSKFTFSTDTRNFFNITMGSSGDNKVRGDYFATGWNSFELPKTPLLANTGLPTNYNITNVLSSLGNSRLTTANFTTIFAYNGTAWSSFVVGAVTNTFTNFTADTPNSKYYINITVTNERLEVN